MEYLYPNQESTFQLSRHPPLAFSPPPSTLENMAEGSTQANHLFSLGYDSLLGPNPTAGNEGHYRRSTSSSYDRSQSQIVGTDSIERDGNERSQSTGEGRSNLDRSRAEGSNTAYRSAEPSFIPAYSSTSTIQGGYFSEEGRERTSSRYTANANVNATTPTSNTLLMSPLSPLVKPFSPSTGSSSGNSNGNSNLPWAAPPNRSNPILSNDRAAQAQQMQQQQLEYQQQVLFEQERERMEDFARQQAHFDRLEYLESQSTPMAPRAQPSLTNERSLPSLGLSGMGDRDYVDNFSHSVGDYAHENGHAGSWSSSMSLNESKEDRTQGLRGLKSGITPSNSSLEGLATGTEEISTIFVVGFPEDMLEREFQNMFVLSIGFEAATLKIPSSGKSNGSVAGSDRPSTGNYQELYGGMLEGSIYDDTFNLPLEGPNSVSNLPHMLSNLSATRSSAGSPALAKKQIIGFAKFRTRAQALEVRDLLSGKRVDAEKGSVLKAEMAKKNLHTKRGISNELGLNNVSTLNPAVLAELARQNAVAQQQQNSTATFIPSSAGTQSGLQSTAAFDAFHSVPPTAGVRRDREPSGISSGNYPLPGAIKARGRQSTNSESYYEENPALPPSAAYYSLPRSEGPSSSVTSPALPQQQRFQPAAPIRERNQTTSPDYSEPPRIGFEESNQNWNGKSLMQHLDQATNLESEREQQAQLIYQAQQIQLQNLQQTQQNFLSERQQEHFRLQQISPLPPNQFNSVHENYIGEDRNAYQNLFQANLVRNGTGGVPMGQSLSGGGSASIPRTQNPADMNAPKNTLYVGGLPAVLPSLTGPFSAAHLEDSLRNAFSRCPGFRRLCFRSKSNGPIVFVEFDDVIFATRALQDMYGNQLGGIVKGGIRLSYSKNPLGVRAGTGNSPGPLSPLSLNSADNIFTSALYGSANNRRPSESVFGPGSMEFRNGINLNPPLNQQNLNQPRTVGGFGNGFGNSSFSPFAFEQQ